MVRDPDIHCEVIDKVSAIPKDRVFCLVDILTDKRSEGNIEYLLYIKKSFR